MDSLRAAALMKACSDIGIGSSVLNLARLRNVVVRRRARFGGGLRTQSCRAFCSVGFNPKWLGIL